MKLKLLAVSFLLTAIPATAEYRIWTNSEGVEAKLDLLWSTDVDGEKVGEFKMANGTVVEIKASDLSDEDAKFLKEWEPVTRVTGPATAFDKVLDNQLVSLQGDQLKKLKEYERPKKYYIFYYTAYWCGPCRQFTPSLVEWYNENKNDNFELVLISSDRGEDAMLKYAKEKQMPWPQLAFGKKGEFKEAHNHGVRGIPSLIVCEVNGKNLGNFRGRFAELTEMVK